MGNRKRNDAYRQYAHIFLLGVVFGGFLSSFYSLDFIQRCTEMFHDKQLVKKVGDEKTQIFVGIIRSTTDETGAMRRLITRHGVHAKIFPTNQRQDITALYIHPVDLDRVYDHKLSYQWFVLTADVIVDIDIIEQLLLVVSTRAPVAVLHPGCFNVSVLVVNQAALRLVSDQLLSGHTSLCEAFKDVGITSLQKLWFRYEERSTSRSHKMKYNISLTFSLQNEDLHTVFIRHQQQRIHFLRQRLAILKEQINFINMDTLPARPQSWNPVQHKNTEGWVPDNKEWSFINSSLIHSLSNVNAQPVESVRKRGRQFLLNTSQSATPQPYSCHPKFVYQKVDVAAGVLHVVVYDNNASCNPNYRSIQPFEGYSFMEGIKPKDKNIVMLLPLFKRSSVFSRFYKRLHSVALDYKGTLMVKIVLFKDKSGDYKKTLEYIKQTSGNIIVNVIPGKGKFSRAKAIVQGLENVHNNTRILIMDVDMMFTVEFLERVVKATKQSKQAYFPIQFSRYDPQTVFSKNTSTSKQSVKRSTYSEEFGRWRYFSYGIVGIYKSDLINVGSFNTAVEGWGLEDVFFFENCLTSGLTVFRSVDPGLWHMYHNRHCPLSLSPGQLVMCRRSRIEVGTSIQSLASYVLGLHH